MALEQFNEAEISVIRDLSSINLYMFTRWMFRERRGYQWTQARHHALICDALERVFNNETPDYQYPAALLENGDCGSELHRMGDGARTRQRVYSCELFGHVGCQ